jgi:hypothetical protein
MKPLTPKKSMNETVVQNRLQMFALNAEVVFSEVDNQKKSIEEAQVTLATSEKFIPIFDSSAEECKFE